MKNVLLELSTAARGRTVRTMLLYLLLVLPVACASTERHTAVIEEASIMQLQQAMTDGQLTAVDLVDHYLKRIEAYDDQGPQINAILLLNPRAREQAHALDIERQSSGPRSLLHGIPVIIKDNYSTSDMPTTGASRALQDFIPNRNATQIDLLLQAGAIILAKANLHEFAYGITTISSLGGQTRNPYDLQRMPGGSSGGTAAAIAANFASFGMGSDTCGSIRIPAAFNNLVGLRPTKGLSSIYGIMPLSATQDVAGPLARSLEDLAIVLDILAVNDPSDPATELLRNRTAPAFQVQLNSGSLQGVRLGRLDVWYDAAEEEVRTLLDQALTEMVRLGAEVVPITIEDMARLLGASGLIGHEFEEDLNSYLREFGSTQMQSLEQIVATGLHHEAVHNLLTRSAAAEQDVELYQAAMAMREVLKQAVEQAMQEQNVDIIVYPPIASLPALAGEPQTGNNCSLSGNSGLPALSIPVGFTAQGLPVGLELLGAQLSDATLLAVARVYEQATQQRRAPVSTPALPFVRNTRQE